MLHAIGPAQTLKTLFFFLVWAPRPPPAVKMPWGEKSLKNIVNASFYHDTLSKTRSNLIRINYLPCPFTCGELSDTFPQN